MTDTDWKARLTAVRDVLSALSEAGCPTHDPHDGTCSVCNVLDSVDAALDALSSLTDAARTHDDRVRAEGDAAGYAPTPGLVVMGENRISMEGGR